jgi:oligoendopeptidase F
MPRFHTQPYQPRKFLPENADLTQIETLRPLYDQLREQLKIIDTTEALESWLSAYGELSAAIDQIRSERYIEMTCDTTDTEAERRYLHFVEVLDPWLKPIQFEIKKLLVANTAFSKLPPNYAVFIRSTRNAIALFHPENVERETGLNKLSQRYSKIIGSLTASFDGEEQTLPKLSRLLEEPDRARRQAAWEAITESRLKQAEALDALFSQMLPIRDTIAKTVHYDNFRDYTFSLYERFDYTPQDCETFHSTIESYFVPLCRTLQQQRKTALHLETLRPWDLAVDPLSRPPLRPFKTTKELSEKVARVFERLDSRLARYFKILIDERLTDLDNRKGKAPGGYQSTLEEARLPFIFMNAVGTQRDVETLLHEAGHAFHTLAARDQSLYAYRSAPIEFCEVASMSMELLAADHLDLFYNDEDRRRACRDHLEGIIKFFPWMATVDAFQHWIYTNPNHTVSNRHATWQRLLDRFGGIEDYTGYEAARATTWHRQLHIFEYPFYYVEYGIAQLGALQLWRHFKQSPREALDLYLQGLSLGGSCPLPELFQASGLKFDFSPRTVAPLIEMLNEALDSLRE